MRWVTGGQLPRVSERQKRVARWGAWIGFAVVVGGIVVVLGVVLGVWVAGRKR